MQIGATRTRELERAEAPPARALPRRLGLLFVVGVAVLVASQLARPDPRILLDPELTRLLRAMALIKAALAGGALVLVLWRFGWGISLAPATLYGVGSAMLAAAVAWLWQPSQIAGAALVFHAGIVALLVAAGIDGARGRWLRSGPARRSAARKR